MKIKSNIKLAVVAAGIALASNASAVQVTTGEFELDFDEQGLLDLSAQVRNTGWFDSVVSADKTPQEMRDTPPSDSVPDSFVFKVFGSSIPTPPVGLQERAPQVSTFEYEDDPTNSTGLIGLSGFHVIDTLLGGMSMGDYSLSYDATRIGTGGNNSGWAIDNHHAFLLKAFDLANVEITLIDDTNFSMSGDVVIASGLSLMLGADEGTDVGDFTFTTVAEADPYIDGTVANYSFETELLILPVVKVGDENLSVTMRLVTLADGQAGLELKSADLTDMQSEKYAEFDSSTGELSIPELVLLENTTAGANKIMAELQLEANSFPSKFTIKTIQDVAE